MKLLSWFKVLRRRTRRPNPRSVPPRLELLEDRSLPSGSPALAGYGGLPLAFEVNEGQTAPQVDFLARGEGYQLFLAPTSATLQLRGPAPVEIQLEWLGANSAAIVAGQDQLITRSNYLIGNNPEQWHTNIANYATVRYQDVYPGIDLLYYGNQGQLEYDFVVDPGVDPGVIAMSIHGAQRLSLDARGNLVLGVPGGELVQQAPVIYQEIDGRRQPVAGQFVLTGDREVGYHIGAYDVSRPLVIDPVLTYSTYLGGSGADSGQAIAVDAAGNAYITGYTYSANFPTSAGAFQGGFGGSSDVFVAKLSPTGTSLVYATYLGGDWDDEGSAIAVDTAGRVAVTGVTGSADFPTTASAVQPVGSANGNYMAFVTQLDASGSTLLYSTYLGTTSDEGYVEWGQGIAVDAAGKIYVAGYTDSGDFITTPGAFQPSSPLGIPGDNQSFVAKIDPTQAGAASLIYSTYLNGTTAESRAYGIAVNASGVAYVTGWTESSDFPTTAGAYQTVVGGGGDVFVTALNAAGSGLVYSTFLGGSIIDYGSGIALDAAGNAYIGGTTQSSNFPTTAGALQGSYRGGEDAFITKLNATGSGLVYSTFLGGTGTDEGMGIAVDGAGRAFITGITGSTNLPTTANALQSARAGGYDAFLSGVNDTGSALVYSSYLGGSGDDYGMGIAIDGNQNAFLAGESGSTNFPTTPGALQRLSAGSYDAFLTRIDLSGLTLSIGNASVSERNAGTTLMTFTVALSASAAATVTVAYATANGTATAGSDYQGASGTLTFAPGETSKSITVPVIGDRLGEPNETVLVNLSSPVNASIANAPGVGTILDDEPRISISDVTLLEGGRGQTTRFVFTVTLSLAYDQAVTVSFRTADGTAKSSAGDYVARSGTLTFAPGETTRMITIDVTGDSKKEGTETFFLDLFGNSSNSLFSKNRGIGTILNDD